MTGHWSSVIDYTDNKSSKKRTLFDASRADATPKTVLPESEQEENESRRYVQSISDSCFAAENLLKGWRVGNEPDLASSCAESRLGSGSRYLEETLIHRQWAKLTTAIKNGDMHGATAEKNVVEERQRELARKREAEGASYSQRFFKSAGANKWMPKLDLDK